MDFSYSAGLTELRGRARALGDEIRPHEEQCEVERGLPRETLAAIADQVRHHRLNAINMPAEWGGQGLGIPGRNSSEGPSRT